MITATFANGIAKFMLGTDKKLRASNDYECAIIDAIRDGETSLILEEECERMPKKVRTKLERLGYKVKETVEDDEYDEYYDRYYSYEITWER